MHNRFELFVNHTGRVPTATSSALSRPPLNNGPDGLAGHQGRVLMLGITTGSRTLDVPTYHLAPAGYVSYLDVVAACDVGVFAGTLAEGWSRCAAETVLLGVPSLIQPVAGLGDLARLTGQPAPHLPMLDAQIRHRTRASKDCRERSRKPLLRQDTNWFGATWRELVASTQAAVAPWSADDWLR